MPQHNVRLSTRTQSHIENAYNPPTTATLIDATPTPTYVHDPDAIDALYTRGITNQSRLTIPNVIHIFGQFA